jgi:hypothetical protein
LARLLAGVFENEAALLAATSASNWAADKRLRSGIWDDEGMELLGGAEDGGGDDNAAAAGVMTSVS